MHKTSLRAHAAQTGVCNERQRTRVVCKEFWSFLYAFATHLSKATQKLTVLDTLPG
jgi:hypothetical protein